MVPRDTDRVLIMKRGDCKDHATLLQAMLSSAGVPSSQALIHSGEMYELPELPYAAVENYPHDFLCNGDVRTEKMRMRFPPTVKLLPVPHDVDVVQPDMIDSARYEQHDNELRVVRTLIDNSPGPVCGAALVAQYRAIAEAVKKGMQVQAVYQPR